MWLCNQKGGVQRNREDTAITKPLPNCLALTKQAQCNRTIMQHTTQAKSISERKLHSSYYT